MLGGSDRIGIKVQIPRACACFSQQICGVFPNPATGVNSCPAENIHHDNILTGFSHSSFHIHQYHNCIQTLETRLGPLSINTILSNITTVYLVHRNRQINPGITTVQTMRTDHYIRGSSASTRATTYVYILKDQNAPGSSAWRELSIVESDTCA